MSESSNSNKSFLNDADRKLLTELASQLDSLNQQRALTVHNRWSSLLFMQLMKGLALGLGSALGASLALSFFLYLLSQISFVPIIGEIANEVLAEMSKYQSNP